MSNTDSRGSAKISLVDQPHANAVSEMQCSISQVGLYFLFIYLFFGLDPQETSGQNLLLILNKPKKYLYVTLKLQDVFSEVKACATLPQSRVYTRMVLSLIL